MFRSGCMEHFSEKCENEFETSLIIYIYIYIYIYYYSNKINILNFSIYYKQIYNNLYNYCILFNYSLKFSEILNTLILNIIQSI